MQLEGTVQTGVGNAAYWLELNADAYGLWTGMDLVPGSLNVLLPAKFDWDAAEVAPFKKVHSLVPYGGNRDICLIPCEIYVQPADRIYAFAWATTVAAAESDHNVLEIITATNLRSALGLADGDRITMTIPLPWNI